MSTNFNELHKDLKINHARFLDLKNKLAVELQSDALKKDLNKKWGAMLKLYDHLKDNMRQLLQDPDYNPIYLKEIERKADVLLSHVEEIEDEILDADISAKTEDDFVQAVVTLKDIIADILEEGKD
jgi:hypothetical protein